MKFRKKPVVIEAMQFDGSNGQKIADFMQCQFPAIQDGKLLIGTLEGTMSADIKDWIIKGVKGEFYPCKPDIFEATYEKVDELPNILNDEIDRADVQRHLKQETTV